MVAIAEADVMEKRLLASSGKSGAVGARVTKSWHFIVKPDGPSAAAFLNVPPAQGAGEAFAIGLPDGTVGVFYFL